MTAIKVRPILFSAPMVRAILDGRKTVTRRPVKGSGLKWLEDFTPEHVADPANSLCPFGKPGDRLWVRETFAGPLVDEEEMHLVERDGWDAFRKPEHCQYRASGGSAEFYDHTKEETVSRWTPSIHMPRWASRILLEITEVRVERLQHITIGQICKEGLARSMYEFIPVTTAFDAFAELWNSTGGNWDANPWVWVVDFKQATP